MAMFAGEKKRKFNWGRAAAAFFGGDDVLRTFALKDQRAAKEAEAAQNQQAAQTAFSALKNLGLPDEVAQTIALDPDARAKFLGGEYESKNVAPGSNIAGRNPETNKYETLYRGAPRQHVIDERIVNEDGTPVYESPYAKIIPGPNGSFFQQDRIGINGAPPAVPQARAPIPLTDIDPREVELIEDEEKKGGAGRSMAFSRGNFR